MTPEEKAIELIKKFRKLNQETDTCFGECELSVCTGTGHGCGLWIDHAKQCAIICCDEILADYEVFNQKNKSYKVPSFWQLVKQEIVKL